jgi:multicomponent Na+:H+ antiporter subunit D
MRDQPFFTALFAILALSISGVPPLSGFWAKFLVIDAAFRGEGPWDPWLAVIALVTGILTLYSMSIVWTRGFWRTPDDERRSTRRIPGAMLLAIALLAASTIGIGLAVEPMARFSRESANQLQARAVTPIVEGVTR